MQSLDDRMTSSDRRGANALLLLLSLNSGGGSLRAAVSLVDGRLDLFRL